MPSLRPVGVTGFRSRDDFVEAALAITTLPAVTAVRAPLRRLGALGGAWCADGVNPLSLWGVIEYLARARCERGAAARAATARAAPPHTFSAPWPPSGRDPPPSARIHAMWNAPVMRVLLAAADGDRDADAAARVWITPTVGGRLEYRHALNFCPEYLGKLWERGYAHARALDELGYFGALDALRRDGRDGAARARPK